MIAQPQIDGEANDWIFQPLDPPFVFSLEMLFLYAGNKYWNTEGPVPTKPF